MEDRLALVKEALMARVLRDRLLDPLQQQEDQLEAAGVNFNLRPRQGFYIPREEHGFRDLGVRVHRRHLQKALDHPKRVVLELAVPHQAEEDPHCVPLLDKVLLHGNVAAKDVLEDG